MEDKKQFLSPASLALAAISFLLPWLAVECQGESLQTMSGMDVAEHTPLLYVVPVIAIGLIAAFFFLRSKRQLSGKKWLFILGPVVAIAAIVISWITSNTGGIEFMGEKIKLSELGVKYRYGIVIHGISWIASIIGVQFLKDTNDKA